MTAPTSAGERFTVVTSGTLLTLEAIDRAIETVSTVRAGLGAAQNRLEPAADAAAAAAEQLAAARSRIQDADVALEMSRVVRSQVLSQAGTAVLAQARSGAQDVLALLRG
ncbi:flagellin [Cellulomonas cellasea]|uniref:Flagellin C-terminal domain-containing protein n=2 Tax=Cellulomonas cellasea TaxID=43670 RepID=A0A0A0B303_9CELL|nr:flagellin [Cellulomonas cellasea]KGM00552.1 hypothetical protein Q760_08095 [Cellulomonas cellasea DSM 20118]GEA86813.1 hypothetical protein CCE01nite_07620 [Cellulomonas cellasea]